VLASVFLTCAIALGSACVLLLVLGHRVRFASRVVGIVFGGVLAVGAGEVAARLWDLPSSYVEVGQAVVFVAAIVVVLARPAWNPFGQVFFATFVAAIGVYLAGSLVYTFGGGLSPIGIAAALLLFVFEFVALLLASSFAFETCDVVCRTRWTRAVQAPDPA
jgi:hypothetical protein